MDVSGDGRGLRLVLSEWMASNSAATMQARLLVADISRPVYWSIVQHGLVTSDTVDLMVSVYNEMRVPNITVAALICNFRIEKFAGRPKIKSVLSYKENC